MGLLPNGRLPHAGHGLRFIDSSLAFIAVRSSLWNSARPIRCLIGLRWYEAAPEAIWSTGELWLIAGEIAAAFRGSV